MTTCYSQWLACTHILKATVLSRGLRPGRHPEEDDIVPELAHIHPRDRPDWEETISAMARSAEIPELRTEPLMRSCSSSTASMKVKNVKKLCFTKGHFPKLAECAHFHYENVDFGTIQLSLGDEQCEVTRNGYESKELVYLVQIYCQGRSWIVKRSYEDFRVLDKHLHLCIYDRRFSQLPELPRFDSLTDQSESVSQMLLAYLSRLSAIADNQINCGPALTWMEVDNKGNHLLVHEESSINVPAIAAAHVIKRYIAQAADELSFEVGDIVSVIDMPPKEDTTWWRGKHGFQVGFFPSECVELINDKVPQSMTNSVPKPVSKKHGKLITFLRTFMKSRPTKQKLKQRGILRERVFGCDLGEHLLNSGHDVPQVLKSCTEFIEKHGVVDGIYRLSGIASNIQKLRHEFDSEQIPDLTKDVYIQDIHCVGSLCKLYFRELPNPLLTYQLYEKFSDAVSAATDEERLIKIHDVIQQLPPPHYRTLEFLMRHLSHLATFSYITNMHSKNLAIVWAPNLLRSKQIESACFSGTAAFMEVRIQSVVVEFILNHVDVLFSAKLNSLIREGAGHNSLSRPKSLLVSSPSTKLLSLEEAQARTQAQINSPVTEDSKYIEVGEGPAALQGKFHTVIEFPTERKRPPIKSKKSPVGSWRSFFNLGKSSSMSKRKLHRNPSEPNELKAMALAGGRGDTGTLRSAKSEESLTSLHNVEGESKVYRPRRPRSSSDALSASFNGELLDSRQHCNSYDNLDATEDSDGDDGPICVPALISPPRSAGEDVDLSPPDIGMASLDFDPMSFQCSLPDTPYSFPLDDSPAGAEGSTLKRSSGSVCGKANAADPMFCFVFVLLPGVVALESSKDPSPGSLSSMPSLSAPPPPPPKNAARMLALALAESAQQASIQSQIRSSEPPAPVSPLPPQEASEILDSSLPPVPQLQAPSKEGTASGSSPAPNATPQTPATASYPATSKPAKHHDHYGPTPPTPPIRTIESKLATAALSQTEASFHIMGEGSTPGLLEDALPHHPPSPRKSSTHQSAHLYHTKGEPVLMEPAGAAYYHQRSIPMGPQSMPHHYRPDSVPPHLSYVSKSEPQIPYSARSRSNPRSVYVSPGPGHQGQGYGPMDRAHGYPTIRRVHSLHVPSTIRSVPIQRTEVPPDDDMFFYHRPVYQCKSYQQPPQQSSQADYHVTQLQPYFENGRVQYRYSPYSGPNPLEAPFYDVDPYGTIRLRHFHSYSSRDPGASVGRPGGKATGYHYITRHVLPPGKEHSFVSRDMPPSHGPKGAAVYFAWDPEESERLRMHSIRRESRARQKIKGPVLSQYDNVGLFTPADISGYETLHLRSKSDPGKAILVAAESKDGRYHARHMVSDPDVLMYMETDKHGQGSAMGDKSESLAKQSASKKCQSSHSLPATLSHSLSHQQESSRHEAKYESGDDKLSGDGSRSKHWQQEYPSKRNFQPRYECPDPDHHQSKGKSSSGYHSTDEQPSAPREQVARAKPERSHSVREQTHYSQGNPDLDRDYSYQKHSTKTVQSHYDNLDDYHPVPQPQAPVQKRGGSSSYPTPGYTVAHSNRAYSTALGQGAFIQTDLAMQRPETEIRTE
uniref:Rho GTPase-activating protein 32 n=1 Tax=Myripristis murdjan TaxID=586833 RepID=A0A667ZH74_9TELE